MLLRPRAPVARERAVAGPAVATRPVVGRVAVVAAVAAGPRLLGRGAAAVVVDRAVGVGLVAGPVSVCVVLALQPLELRAGHAAREQLAPQLLLALAVLEPRLHVADYLIVGHLGPGGRRQQRQQQAANQKSDLHHSICFCCLLFSGSSRHPPARRGANLLKYKNRSFSRFYQIISPLYVALIVGGRMRAGQRRALFAPCTSVASPRGSDSGPRSPR